MYSVRILIPCLPLEKEIFFRGYVFVCGQNELIIYIINYFTKSDKLFDLRISSKELIYGYCGTNLPLKKFRQTDNYLLITQNELNIPQLKKLIILKNQINVTNNCIFVLYDLNTVKESQIKSNKNDYFAQLRRYIHKDSGKQNEQFVYNPLFQNNSWSSSSMFLQYMLNYINLLVWLLTTLKSETRVSFLLKFCNLVLQRKCK